MVRECTSFYGHAEIDFCGVSKDVSLYRSIIIKFSIQLYHGGIIYNISMIVYSMFGYTGDLYNGIKQYHFGHLLLGEC